MMKHNTITARLRDRSGESIGEVLAALLVAAIAMMMLASMVAASSNLIEESEQTMENYIAAQNKLAAQTDSDGEGTVTLEKDGKAIELYDGADTDIKVNYYQNTVAGTPVIAYRVK